METKYGSFSEKAMGSYRGKLISKIFKLLPLKEERCSTLEDYLSSVVFEVKGYYSMLNDMASGIELMAILESLRAESDFTTYRREVFHAISLLKKSNAHV